MNAASVGTNIKVLRMPSAGIPPIDSVPRRRYEWEKKVPPMPTFGDGFESYSQRKEREEAARRRKRKTPFSMSMAVLILWLLVFFALVGITLYGVGRAFDLF
jgi:hypothetical protein